LASLTLVLGVATKSVTCARSYVADVGSAV